MANVLTSLAADIYVAADQVGRELVGAASSVMINANGSDRVAVGDVVRSAFTRPATAVNVVAAMAIPEGTDQTVDNKTATITKARAVQIPWTGEDMKHVNNGAGFGTIYGDQIKQAMRAIVNEIEIDLCSTIALGASRAYGTAGTNPFATDFNAMAEVRKILVDNGSPTLDITAVLNTEAGAKLRNLAQLQKANEAGNDQLLRQGVLLDLQGIALKESAGIATHVAGTGASYTSTAAGFAIGTTSIPLITGTGTVIAGDVVTFAGDTNKYIVVTGVAAPGTIVIAEPGLRKAIPASATAMTIAATSVSNIVFQRNSAELIMRPIATPDGDAADDSMIIQDPHSLLVFEIRSYKGYRKAMFEVSAAWGQKLWKPEFAAQLLG